MIAWSTDLFDLIAVEFGIFSLLGKLFDHHSGFCGGYRLYMGCHLTSAKRNS